MRIGTLRVSRWLQGIEMLMCFVWLTLMFAALVSRGAFGFSGPLTIDSWYAMALLGTLGGPIGLIVAFKATVLNRPSTSRITLIALCLCVAWTFVAMGGMVFRGPYSTTEVGPFILLALLPAFGALHLVYLARPMERPATAA